MTPHAAFRTPHQSTGRERWTPIYGRNFEASLLWRG
jgi:hypothetical protein